MTDFDPTDPLAKLKAKKGPIWKPSGISFWVFLGIVVFVVVMTMFLG